MRLFSLIFLFVLLLSQTCRVAVGANVILYPEFACEGRALYKASSAQADLPFVVLPEGVFAATLAVENFNPLTFRMVSLQIAHPNAYPAMQPCHATLDTNYDGRTLLNIPFVDLPAAGKLYHAVLQQSPKDETLFILDYADEIKMNRLEPLTGAYFGINLDWGNNSVSGISKALNINPNVLVRFVHYPISEGEKIWLDQAVEQVAVHGGIMLLTLEPHSGLGIPNEQTAQELALRLKAYNQQGVDFIVRFAHEMNGSWYSWGQQPTLYIKQFRILAQAIHSLAARNAMMWAPNYGGGYPFSGGIHVAEPGSPDFDLLDTNRNGELDRYDNSYSPYYPGDDVVDWVGMSLYHWGNSYPWGDNDIPEHSTFAAKLLGEYVGEDGDHRMVPNFYRIYAEGKNKPLGIAETAALFVPARGNDTDERIIKQLWWRQIFSLESRRLFPQIKMLNWFDWIKTESEIGGETVDWRVSHNGALAQAFVQDLKRSRVGINISR